MKKIRETGLDFIVREPLDVDFFVDPKPLTKEENKLISDFIKIDKQKRRLLKTTKKASAQSQKLKIVPESISHLYREMINQQ